MPTATALRGSAPNVGSAERAASVLAGSVLAMYGVRRRDLPGVMLAGLGVLLVERGWTARCPVYQSLGISTASFGRLRRQHGPAAVVDAERAERVEERVIIDAEPMELYRWWRDFQHLPRALRHVESVTVLSNAQSHWVASTPDNVPIEWDAEIIRDEPGRLISWKTIPPTAIPHAGSVWFRRAPRGGGTELCFTLEYEMPGGRIESGLAHLLGADPAAELRDSLRRFAREWSTVAG